MRKLIPYVLVIIAEVLLAAAQGCSNSAPVCPSEEGLAEELSSTPRAEPNLEQLAIAVRPFERLTADQATYDRIVRDVTAARALEPEVSDVSFMPMINGRSLRVDPGPENIEAARWRDYHDLDCFLDTYDGEIVGIAPDTFALDGAGELLHLRFTGIYDMQVLASRLEQIPGVRRSIIGTFDADAEGGFAGDGPTICLTTSETTWHYIFVDTDGPCEGKCGETTDFYVTSEPSGEITMRGRWVETLHESPPRWMIEHRIGECGNKMPFPPRPVRK